MFKIIAFVFMVVACVCAKPKPDVIAYSAPVVAAPFASSAVVSREFHGNTAPYVAAYSYPYATAYAAPYVAAAPYSAYASTVLL
ncbi:uncharacterized protein LOC129569171 [Sitodiplosis mosellana]|uniref:uncharacterized protein LOC129569171 n=1 Tax=Sitodiplosis mosellana TaxID=263140 RepID=UPI0024443B3C|nr:uncharacterized protein LOC129569171 [Sitodiplosis mosellana]